MGKQRCRNWVLNNPFFQKSGQFSKSAFIMITTWALVIFKYLISGFTFSYTKVATTIGSIVIPATNISYSAKFDYGEAVALLTLVFGLYFGNKFSPNGGNNQADLTKETGK